MATAKEAGEPTDRLGFLLARHGAITDTRMRSALGAAGLGIRHAMTLMYLDAGPVSQQALIEKLSVDPSVLVAILNDLEREDLARRRRDPVDRRRHNVEITAEGVVALRATEVALTEVEDELFADLSDRDRASLRRLLGRIRTVTDHYQCDER